MDGRAVQLPSLFSVTETVLYAQACVCPYCCASHTARVHVLSARCASRMARRWVPSYCAGSCLCAWWADARVLLHSVPPQEAQGTRLPRDFAKVAQRACIAAQCTLAECRVHMHKVINLACCGSVCLDSTTKVVLVFAAVSMRA